MAPGAVGRAKVTIDYPERALASVSPDNVNGTINESAESQGERLMWVDALATQGPAIG